MWSILFCKVYPFDNRWKHSNDIIEPADRLSTEDCVPMWKLWYYERLRIADVQSARSLLTKYVDVFWVNLRQIEIDRFDVSCGQIFVLRLENLKVFSVGSIYLDDSAKEEDQTAEVIYLKVEAPNLQTVFLGETSIYKVEFAYPESVDFLSVDEEQVGIRLSVFKNLKVLECNKIRRFCWPVVKQFITGELGKLRKLHCNLDNFINTLYLPEPDEVDYLRSLFNDLAQTATIKPDLISADLQIYLNGILINLTEPFSVYRFDLRVFEMQTHNMRRTNGTILSPCRSLATATYSTFQSLLEAFNADFYFLTINKLYPNLRDLRIQQSPEKPAIQIDTLIRFLDTCPGWHTLEFDNTGFVTAFYNRLATIPSCRLLQVLTIFESSDYVHNIDFEFVLKFRFLQNFETNAAPRELMLHLLGQITRFMLLSFYFADFRYLFLKTGPLSHWSVGKIPSPNRYLWGDMWKSFTLFPYESLNTPDIQNLETPHWIPFDSFLHQSRLATQEARKLWITRTKITATNFDPLYDW